MPITTTIELITPEKAKEYIALNVSNQRNLRERVVHKYARDMANGNWKLTHCGIAFSVSGRTIDGNHRLHGIVEAGVPVEMMVTRGLPDETMAYIDNGASRSVNEQLKILNPDDRLYGNPHINGFIRFVLPLVGIISKSHCVLSVNEMKYYIDKYHGACEYYDKIIPHTKYVTGYIVTALVCAKICGVKDKEIIAIRNFMTTNENTGDNYNWKSLIDFKQKCIEGKYAGGREFYYNQFIDAKRAIYMFVNNIYRTKKSDIYPITKEMLQEFSDNYIGDDDPFNEDTFAL